MYGFFSEMFMKISHLSIAADNWKPFA